MDNSASVRVFTTEELQNQPTILRRDGKSALSFKGKLIGQTSIVREFQDEEGEEQAFNIRARLYRSDGGKYVAEVNAFDQIKEHYCNRNAIAANTLLDLAEDLRKGAQGGGAFGWLDDDVLGELFRETEVAHLFIEQVDPPK